MNLDQLLLGAWREVCRHLDIEESARGLLDTLSAGIPVRALVVRRWDEERSRLDTVALAGLDDALPLRTNAPTPRREEFLRWATRGRAESWVSREVTALARFLVPDGVAGPLAAGPLLEGDRAVGVLVLVGELRPHLDAVQALLDPFVSALANDHRLHELARLREAAESDRRALLVRLGREEVGDTIVGADLGLRPVMDRLTLAAPADVPVLLLGETGSGKEVLARTLHARSRRATGPFLKVNCGAIPPELVDSELFGHERGSFTGATSSRRGWFERADGGTLFLDEVAELPLAAQVRLLRVLQDGSFQRVGGEAAHTADVRVVAATHRDLAALVREGRFRPDLWFRLSVFPVTIPALRDHLEDLPALARHFADRSGRRLFGRPLVPTGEDLARLAEHDWPGNVRELAAVIERAAILGIGEGLDLRGFGASRVAPAGDGDDPATIRAALERCLGRIEGPFGAARALGVNPHTLRARMRRLGIDWAAYRRPPR